MPVKIDPKGRVQLPKTIRELLDLQEGEELRLKLETVGEELKVTLTKEKNEKKKTWFD